MTIKKIDDKTLEKTTTIIKEYTLEDLQFKKEDIETKMATLQTKLDEVNNLLKELK